MSVTEVASALVGRRLAAVSYIGLNYAAADIEWDFDQWHHPEVGVELLTDDGEKFCVTWGASVTARWMDSTDDVNPSAGNLENTADSVVYWDLQGYYDFGDNVSVTFGVRNLTDEDPPYVTNYDDMNTIHYSYDTAGRYMYTRVGLQF